jgi:ech hydrogenase subunit F
MSITAISKLILKTLFRKPATRRYPAVKRDLYARTRGHIRIDIDACIFCGMCSRKCPTKALAVSKDERSWTMDRLRCIICGYCTEVCPKKCLYMENAASAPATGKATETFIQAKAEESTSG